MKIIRPITVDDDVLTDTDIPENDHSVYSAVTTYALGDRVIGVTSHRIYESLQASNTNNPPPVLPATETDWWIDVGAVNLWKMFDGGVATQTIKAEGFTVELTPGRFDSLALLNMQGSTYRVIVTSDYDTPGEVVYDTGYISIEAAAIGDWYQYFYEPIINISDVALTDIPPYADGVLTVEVTAPASTAMLGMLIVGNYRDIGDMQVRPRVSIKDYSIKETDQFGNTTVQERSFSKKLSTEVAIANALIDETVRLLGTYRAIPVVWVGEPIFTSTIIFGFFVAFEFVIEHTESPPKSLYSLSIEGLT